MTTPESPKPRNIMENINLSAETRLIIAISDYLKMLEDSPKSFYFQVERLITEYEELKNNNK